MPSSISESSPWKKHSQFSETKLLAHCCSRRAGREDQALQERTAGSRPVEIPRVASLQARALVVCHQRNTPGHNTGSYLRVLTRTRTNAAGVTASEASR
jgi:hypothetical protein